MKKFLKYFGFTILAVLGLAYLAFLFVLPNVLKIDNFKPDIQKIAKEQAKLNIDFENAKIITTPLLGVGLKADNINVKLPDESTLFTAANIKTRISLPSLFLLTVKVSCLELNKPFINLEILNDEQFKLISLAEDILNAGKEQKLEQAQPIETKKGFQFDPAWIRIKVPCVKINNYKVLVNDLKSKHYLDLHGEELVLGYFNGKVVKIKTYAELFSDENKNITANIDINSFLPAPAPKLDEEDDPAERIDIPFVNPVTMYRNYDLKANLDTKLRIREHNKDITSYGYCNIEDITLKVSHLQLPKSYFRAKTFRHNVTIDTNIYPVKDQNIALFGKINYGVRPRMDMFIRTASIQFNDILILGKAFLDSLQIKNELSAIKAEGSLNANCHIKTNFHKLRSDGFINIKNGGIIVRNLGKVISNANICLNLDDNNLDIKNSSLLIHNSPLYINGKIDKKSYADININANKIALPVIFNAFAPKELREAFNFKSSDLSLDLSLKGKLKNAVTTAKFDLDNTNLADIANNFILDNKKLSGEFILTSKKLEGSINNDDFKFELPKTKSRLYAQQFGVQILDKDLAVNENSILINDKSSIKYSGKIEDYTKLKSINFVTDGFISTDDLVQIIGKEFKPFINFAGSIPVKFTVEGNSKKQTVFVQALTDNANFITPIDFENLEGKNVSLQSVIDLKPNRIKIKKTGLYTRTVNVDEKGNEIVNLEEVLGIDGTIEGNRINLIKLTIPQTLKGKIYVFPQSSFALAGRVFVLGETTAPRLRGHLNLKDVSIPEILLALRNADLRFRGHDAHFAVQDLILNGSDIQAQGNISLVPDSVINMSNINVNSRYLNVDKLMKVVEQAMKYVPQVPPSQVSTVSAQPADIPVTIYNGSINMARIMSGNIDIRNTTSDISMRDNVFYLTNLRTSIFDGQVNGSIAVNLINMLLNVNVSGQNIDVEKALLQAAGMKGMLSGEAKFNADISLQGATYEEQMKTLKGDVGFTVKDGQFGPFGKLENLIIAENIRESQLFQTALGGVISGLTTIDTTHFSDLSGTLTFNNGICSMNPITSLGNILSLHIFGDFDLLKNCADMKVRARMASLVSNLLGPIGAINPVNLLNNAASLNVITAKAFSIFCEMVPAEEIAILPSFSNKYVDNAATKFQLVIRGDVAKPFSLVKSFKWLATASEYEKATNFINSLPEPLEGSTAANIIDMIKEVEAQQKTLKYKLQHIFENKELIKKGN